MFALFLGVAIWERLESSCCDLVAVKSSFLPFLQPQHCTVQNSGNCFISHRGSALFCSGQVDVCQNCVLSSCLCTLNFNLQEKNHLLLKSSSSLYLTFSKAFPTAPWNTSCHWHFRGAFPECPNISCRMQYLHFNLLMLAAQVCASSSCAVEFTWLEWALRKAVVCGVGARNRLQNSVQRGENKFVWYMNTLQAFPIRLCMLSGSPICWQER